MRILIVDDSEDSRDLSEVALRSAGYTDIVATASGCETLKFLDVGRTSDDAAAVDMVLLDIVMPKMDGIEVCACVRSDPRYADLPIIMVTSLDDVSSKANAFVAGATGYITKPVNSIELAAQMHAALRHKQGIADRLHLATETITDVQRAQAAGGHRIMAPASPPTKPGYDISVAAHPTGGQNVRTSSLQENGSRNESARNRSLEVITPLEKDRFRTRLQIESGKLEAIRVKLHGLPATSQDFEELQVVVHKLAGAAGIYGFDRVSLLAAQLEQLIIETKSDGRSAESVDGELAGLLRVIDQAVQCSR